MGGWGDSTASLKSWSGLVVDGICWEMVDVWLRSVGWKMQGGIHWGNDQNGAGLCGGDVRDGANGVNGSDGGNVVLSLVRGKRI